MVKTQLVRVTRGGSMPTVYFNIWNDSADPEEIQQIRDYVAAAGPQTVLARHLKEQEKATWDYWFMVPVTEPEFNEWGEIGL